MRRFNPAARAARFKSKVLKAYDGFKLEPMLAIRAGDADAPGGGYEMLIYDEIGYWGITAKDVVLALAQVPANQPLTVRVNSPGGDAFDGLAIYNAIKAHPSPVTTVVDGLAASAASIIAMAGSSIVMNEASMLMIHDAWSLCIGNQHDMRACADVSAKVDSTMASIYTAQMSKRGSYSSNAQALMDAETWLTAPEAKAIGLADSIVEAIPASANAKALQVLNRAGIVSPQATLPDYDPDGDGDNDAVEALSIINAAQKLLESAAAALTGTDTDDGADSGVEDAGEGGPDGDGAVVVPTQIVPGAEAVTRPKAAATPAEWGVGADRDLPIDDKADWDGPAAAERMLDAAGFNGDSPDPAKAKRGFLVWDHHNPKEKGSYKLPFADMVGSDLRAIKGGIDAAASRLPQTDIPADVRADARKVLDAYEKRMSESPSKESRLRRLRLAEAESF